MNSRGQSGQHRLYMYRHGRPLAIFSSLIPGKSYKLRTNVTGHDLFTYDIYLNYTFGWYYHFSNMYFKIKEIMLKVVYFVAAYNPQKSTICMQLSPSGPTYRQRMHLID